MQAQDKQFTATERELLQENFDVIPHGEPWALNTPNGQAVLEAFVEARGWEGVFIDSIGSAIIGNINSSEVVQSLTNFNDRLRKKFGCFLWYIHHTRKAAPGHTTSGQDDIYGDMYLNARASSSYLVLPAKDNKIRVRNTKQRLAKKEDDYLLDRNDNLQFSKSTTPVDKQLEQVVQADKKKGPNDTAGNFDL